MNDPILTARDVRKTFISGERPIEVLRGVSLEIGRRESVSIRGESGSGKSTLLHLLARLDEPDSGSISWGQGVSAKDRADYLGMVFQSFYLIPEMDALANVLMAARIRGELNAQVRERAKDLLAKVGLAERGHHLPGQLSGGERQRVAVARALMNNPQLLLADEPTGNLDEKTGDAVIDLLLSLCAETDTALVLVTHNAAHAKRCARELILRDGVLGEGARKSDRNSGSL